MNFIQNFKKRLLIKLHGAPNYYRSLGAKIGTNCHFYDLKVDELFPFLLTVGDNVILTGSEILTHDASTKLELGYTKIGEVVIGSNVFVGVGSVILPNTHIGDNVVIGAGSVVSGTIPSDTVAVGIPAKRVTSYHEYMERMSTKLGTRKIEWDPRNLSEEQKAEIQKLVKDGICFIS